MLTTSVMGDKLTHGAVVITGSGDRKANGQPVARLGDMVNCPIHGKNPIVKITAGMPMTDGRATAHETAKSACGAVLLKSIFNTPASKSGLSKADEAITDNDDRLDTEGVGGGSMPGASPEVAARSRALMAAAAGTASDSSPTSADHVEITPPKNTFGRDIPENASDTFKLTDNFTVGDLSTNASCVGTGASGSVVPNKGLSRADIIWNMRHLAQNSLEPLVEKFGKKNIVITSGFRNAENDSDHNIGSAVDIQILQQGEKVAGRDLDAIIKQITEEMKISFTQIINEKGSWIHLACRRDGVNSEKRICWWAGGDYISGYRY